MLMLSSSNRKVVSSGADLPIHIQVRFSWSGWAVFLATSHWKTMRHSFSQPWKQVVAKDDLTYKGIRIDPTLDFVAL
jgi:hypothetical protein